MDNENDGFIESLREALPYIEWLIAFFCAIVMPLSWYYSDIPTVDRWAFVGISVFIIFVATESIGPRKHFRFFTLISVATITILWI